MNLVMLQDAIIANPEYIKTILQKLGYDHIVDRGNYYQFPNKDGDNKTAISILKKTLQYNNYTRGKSGNLFTFALDELNCSFKEMLKFLNAAIGADDNVEINIKLPFGGFFKDLCTPSSPLEVTFNPVNEDSLPDKLNLPALWLKDEVSYSTMEEWGIRLDLLTDKIIIPWYDYSGNICGAKFRSNDADCPTDKRWGMYIPFKKSLCVYGYFQNYKKIIEKSCVIIVEAEKSVLQAYEFGLYICVAIGGHSISEMQAEYIKLLKCKRIIVAFDEGLSEEEIVYEASKLSIDNYICSNKVEYIYDENHDYLLEGSKDSPTDNGKDVFYNLLKNCTRKVVN